MVSAMSRPKFKTVGSVPCWAASYFMYADDSALDEEDKRLCDEFERKLLAMGLRLVCPIDGTRDEFDMFPAFGPGSDVEDWTAEVVPAEPCSKTGSETNEKKKE